MQGEELMMVPLRDAVILFDRDSKKVLIKHWSHPETPDQKLLRSSDGAAFEFWRNASPDELYFRMRQKFAILVRDIGISADDVHRAFLVIPEYRATLPPKCASELDEAAKWPVEHPTNWSSGYPL